MADQLGGTAPALTVEQLKVRVQAGAIDLDDRTVIFVDEASKLDTGHWAELAAAVEHHRITVRAVGHDGQHDAIRLPGLFSEMLCDERIPTPSRSSKVNELAQQKRLQAGELGEQAIRAVDRDYLLRPSDLVAVRNAAYTFPAQPGQPRPKRIENGQVATVEAVDPERDTLTLRLREPAAEPRVVEIDQARLRAEHAAGKRTAALRLNYALHSFPAQGATVHGTATLAGHWSQSKQETYVGDTRAVYQHTVHLAREDLGTDGTDEDRIGRYAQRISADRQRHASIRSAPRPTRPCSSPST